MKKIYLFPVLSVLLMIACTQKPANSGTKQVCNNNQQPSGVICDKRIDNIPFTRAINGADSLISVLKNKDIEFRSGKKSDFFCDPNGKLSNNTAPILLTQVDNTQPFTFTAKVTPNFTDDGLYNAGVLYIYVHDTFWQKFCFEQDEQGNHRVVTVRTIETSDDNNHDVIKQPFVYMKISSDTQTVASYYSLNGTQWQLVRLYKNNYPAKIWLGISNQCPVANGSFSTFSNLTLNKKNVEDFRMGS